MLFNRLRALFNPPLYHGWGRSRKFFEGWYYKIVSKDQKNAFAFIPGIAMDENGKKQAFIQVLDGKNLSAKYHKFNFEDLDAIAVLKASFPAGTVSGAPKVRAMEIVDELEPTKRGIYSGAVGYLDFRGNMDVAIAIRTAVIQNSTLYIQAGAGIVADSNPTSEWIETQNKAKAILKAAEIANEGITLEYDSGNTRTTLEVIQSRSLLLDSRIEFAKAERDFVISKFELAFQLGTLSLNSIKPL